MKPFFKATELTNVIVVRGEPLTENEIKAAFRGLVNAQWYKALVQIVNEDRHNEAMNAASSGMANNALAMATAAGAYQSLSGLLNTLQNYAESEQ
jgi:hypothetical protein